MSIIDTPRDQVRRQNVARMLLEELKQGERRWYYISFGSFNPAHGGVVVHAFGPTDAWRMMHTLDLYPRDADPGDTGTHGPIPEEVLPKIPEEQRWRLLSKTEATNLGK